MQRAESLFSQIHCALEVSVYIYNTGILVAVTVTSLGVIYMHSYRLREYISSKPNFFHFSSHCIIILSQ